MSSKPPRATFWVSTWWPVALATAVICLESTEFMGADHTTGPLRGMVEALFGRFSDASWEMIHHYIRKSGHFLGYGLVGLAWLRAWRRVLEEHSFLFCAGLSMVCTFLVAGSDEWHQTFLPNRTGQFRDVLLDCFGALILITFDYLMVSWFHRRHQAARRSSAQR
jgi:VanZ family protein